MSIHADEELNLRLARRSELDDVAPRDDLARECFSLRTGQQPRDRRPYYHVDHVMLRAARASVLPHRFLYANCAACLIPARVAAVR